MPTYSVPASSGGGSSITAGDTSIAVTDSGTGHAAVNVDGSEVARFTGDADDVALTITNSQDSNNNETATLRLKSTRGTDSDFEIVHDAFGNTEFFSNQPDSDTDKFMAFQTTPKIVFNPNAIDMDVQFAGNNESNLLYLDAGNDRVAIGNASPTKELDVTGDIIASGDMTCNALTQTSMRSLKKNITTITKTKAKAIPFKEYNFKTGNTTRKRYGVVAEDIENDYPELVYDLGNGVKAVNYIDLLVKRVAEMEKELTEVTGTKGDKGDKGKDGNSHLSNVSNIAFNNKTGYLEVTIGKVTQRFAPVDD